MFFPKAMSEIELVVPAADLVRVTKVLGGRGVFHQVEAGGVGGDKERQRVDGWAELATAYAALERRLQALTQTLSVETQAVRTSAPADLVDLDSARDQIDAIEQEVRSVVDRIGQITKSLETLRAHKNQLTTIRGCRARYQVDPGVAVFALDARDDACIECGPAAIQPGPGPAHVPDDAGGLRIGPSCGLAAPQATAMYSSARRAVPTLSPWRFRLVTKAHPAR